MYHVVYATVKDDKEDGVFISGVHFGGCAKTKQEAASIARDCVNGSKNGTVIPKIFEDKGCNIIDVMMKAELQFNKLEADMTTCEDIMSRKYTRH